ncbi:hypothetical protein EV421DRAFT_1744684 [Armillaria borealis]|uniref:Uncharacterized protein n=1 Tax=Armillaria borealis TaxID=47425 RepID=A0AA39MDX6_9AGAR|nr:hypothetical protein EV421DRAFT_1744684 [Armillaria borealis]
MPMGRRTTLLVSANDDDVGYGSFPVEFVVTSSLLCEIALGLQWLSFFHALNIRGMSTPGMTSQSSNPYSHLYSSGGVVASGPAPLATDASRHNHEKPGKPRAPSGTYASGPVTPSGTNASGPISPLGNYASGPNLSNARPFTRALTVARDVVLGDLGEGACVSSAKCSNVTDKDYSACNIVRGSYTTPEAFVVDLIDVILSHCAESIAFPYDRLAVILESVGFDTRVTLGLYPHEAILRLMLHWRHESLPKAALLAFCENHQVRVPLSALVDDIRHHRLQSVPDSEEHEIETDVSYRVRLLESLQKRALMRIMRRLRQFGSTGLIFQVMS